MEHIGKSCMLAENIADDIIANGEIVPPCEVGDKVYDISEFFDGTNCPEIYEYDVSYIRIEKEKGKQPRRKSLVCCLVYCCVAC